MHYHVLHTVFVHYRFIVCMLVILQYIPDVWSEYKAVFINLHLALTALQSALYVSPRFQLPTETLAHCHQQCVCVVF